MSRSVFLSFRAGGRAAALVVVAAVIVVAALLAVLLRDTPSTSATPTPPPGMEAPLGRYEEPPSLSPSAEALPAAPSLISSASAPSVTTGFDGVGQVAGVGSPPDTHAAAGPDRIVEISNGHVAIYSKAGAVIAGGDSGGGAVTLNGFCVGEVASCFDPKVIYDQDSGRFVAAVLELNLGTRDPSTSYLHMMASKTSSPGNLTTDWDKFRHVASATIDATAGWFDYPGLGVSPDAVVVTGNIFSSAGAFVGTKIRVFDKVELYDGDATATFVDIDRNLSGGFTNMPAHHFGSPPSGTFYLLQRFTPAFVRVTALTGMPGSPTVNEILISTSDQGLCLASASQQGTTKVIETVCPRMMNAVWRDGSLWGAMTGSDATDVRTVSSGSRSRRTATRPPARRCASTARSTKDRVSLRTCPRSASIPVATQR